MQIQKLQNGYKCIFKTSAMISIITPGDQAFFSISYIQVWTENRGSGLDKGDLLPQENTNPRWGKQGRQYNYKVYAT